MHNEAESLPRWQDKNNVSKKMDSCMFMLPLLHLKDVACGIEKMFLA